MSIPVQEKALVQDITLATILGTLTALRVQGLLQGGPRGSEIQEALGRSLVANALAETPLSLDVLLTNLEKMKIGVSIGVGSERHSLHAAEDARRLLQMSSLIGSTVRTYCLDFPGVGTICWQEKHAALIPVGEE